MHSRFLLQIISVIVTTLVALSLHARMVVPTPVTILVFGDSLSAGYGVPSGQDWVALLQKKLLAEPKYSHYKVVNASISGETTSGGLARFKLALIVHKPSIVLIELGANDGLRGLKIGDVEQNLHIMITQAKALNAKVLLIGMKIPPNYGLKYTKDFSQIYSGLAKQQQLSLVPFLLENVAGKPDLVQPDGLHPLAVAQPALLDNVWVVLRKMLN